MNSQIHYCLIMNVNPSQESKPQGEPHGCTLSALGTPLLEHKRPGVELGEAALHTRHSLLDCYTVWDGDDVSRPTFSFNVSEKHTDCISSRAV